MSSALSTLSLDPRGDVAPGVEGFTHAAQPSLAITHAFLAVRDCCLALRNLEGGSRDPFNGSIAGLDAREHLIARQTVLTPKLAAGLARTRQST